MTWDFSTEPEFERKLEWTREFIGEDVWPIEMVFGEIDQQQLDRIYTPLQTEVKRQGLWATFPAGWGTGIRARKARAHARGPRKSPFAPNAYHRALMFIVPTDRSGVNIARDVPTMAKEMIT